MKTLGIVNVKKAGNRGKIWEQYFYLEEETVSNTQDRAYLGHNI